MTLEELKIRQLTNQYLIKKGLSASTIHTYLVPVALYHGVDLSLLNLPIRHTADNTRSRKERKHHRTTVTKTIRNMRIASDFRNAWA